MDKIKNAPHKKYEKFSVETVVAHNGVEVVVTRSETYERTEFDEIMADCKCQEEERERIRRRTEKIN